MGDYISKIFEPNQPQENNRVNSKENARNKKKESNLKVRKSISEYQKSKSVTSIKSSGWSPKSSSRPSKGSRQSLYLPSGESMTLLNIDPEIVGPVKLTVDTKKGKSNVYITPNNKSSQESIQSESYAMTMAKYVPQYQQPIKKRGRRWFGRRSKRRSNYSSDSSDSDEYVRPVYESIYTRSPLQRSRSGKIFSPRLAELPPVVRLADSLKEVLNHGLEMINVAAHDPETGIGVRNTIESKLVDNNTSTSFTTELKTMKADGKGHYSFNN